MKEYPILFSGPMVRAILDGRKTQTRRVLNPQPDFAAQPHFQHGRGHAGTGWYCSETEYPDEGSQFYRCPHGIPGDRLWVRETWTKNVAGFFYRADFPLADPTWGPVFWKPSIHMPRAASRITLELTEVRVQRVQEISEADVLAEGVTGVWKQGDHGYLFSKLWDSINADRGYGWNVNPWVWALTFKRA
jgi:hypothetical protein